MRPRSLFHLRSLTAAVLTVLTVAVPAGAAEPGAANTQAIVDLELREVTFNLSQQAYVTALDALNDARRLPAIGPRKDDSTLTLAGLYLSLGLPAAAARTLRELRARKVAVPERAWLNLARLLLQRARLREAEQGLSNLRALPPGPVQAEREYLLSLVLLERKRYAEAIAVAKGLQGDDEWSEVGRYNLAIALLATNPRTGGHRHSRTGRHQQAAGRTRRGAARARQSHAGLLPARSQRLRTRPRRPGAHHRQTGRARRRLAGIRKRQTRYRTATLDAARGRRQSRREGARGAGGVAARPLSDPRLRQGGGGLRTGAAQLRTGKAPLRRGRGCRRGWQPAQRIAAPCLMLRQGAQLVSPADRAARASRQRLRNKHPGQSRVSGKLQELSRSAVHAGRLAGGRQ